MTTKSGKYPYSPYPKTCDLLEGYGIDPSTICADELSLSGYYSFNTSEDSLLQRIFEDGKFARTFHPWPDIFVASVVCESFESESR